MYFSRLFILAAVLGFLFSCQKESVKTDEQQVLALNNDASVINPLDPVGVYHNIAVKHVLKGMNEDQITDVNSDYILSKIEEKYPLFYAEFEALSMDTLHIFGGDDGAYQFFDYFTSQNNTSEQFNQLLKKLFDEVLNENHYDILTVRLNTIEEEAISLGLSEIELNSLLVGTSVARHSAKLWYPEELGGEYGIQYFDDEGYVPTHPIIEERNGINWGSVIISDAIGGIGGALTSLINTGGATAIPNPLLGGVPTAGAVAVAAGVTASVSTGVNQWNNDCGTGGIGNEFYDDCFSCDLEIICWGC